jgi:hypothetical protein
MKRICAACIVIGLLAVRAISAAQGPYSESFAGPGAAPSSDLFLGMGAWTFTGGVARVEFMDSTPYAVPDLATLRPAAAAFTGDYVAAAIELIGFRYRADHVLPSSLYVELKGASSLFQRVLSPPPVGVWGYYMVSLADAASGGWKAKRGNNDNFAAALRDVQSLEVKIRRSGVTAQAHVMDDLFVDGLPNAAGGTSVPGAGTMRVGWDALQSGMPYVLQVGASVAGPWTDTGTVLATNHLHHIDLPAAGPAPQQFFRLRGP